MLEILKTLKDTPLPIVLVIGGLIFLLIPFIQKISSKEVGVETTNQSFAGIIGFILLVTGIGLYIVPSGTATSTPPTSIPPSTTSVIETPRVESTSQVVQPTIIVQPPSNNNCYAYVTRAQVEELKKIQGVSEALKQAQVFSGYLQIDFKPGDKIPAGVLIATDFLTTDIGQYNVIRINSQGGWGLFETTTEIQAPTPGTYRCIQE
jgi:hypothetical protein